MEARNLSIALCLFLASGWASPGTAAAQGGLVTNVSVTPSLVEPGEYVTIKAFATVPAGKKCAVLYNYVFKGMKVYPPASGVGLVGDKPYVEAKFKLKMPGTYWVLVWADPDPDPVGPFQTQMAPCEGTAPAGAIPEIDAKYNKGVFVHKVQVVANKDWVRPKLNQTQKPGLRTGPSPLKKPAKIDPIPRPGPSPVERTKVRRVPVETTQPGRSTVETIQRVDPAVEKIVPETQRGK